MRKIATAAIAIGLAALVSGCSQIGALVSGEVTIDSKLVEKTIEEGVLEQAGFEVSVECPSPMSGQVGDVRQCVVTDEFGQKAFADITIQNRDGYITWMIPE